MSDLLARLRGHVAMMAPHQRERHAGKLLIEAKEALEAQGEWRTIALDSLEALRLMHEHYEDLGASNPGFMGKLTLQKYGVWNKALVAKGRVIAKYAHIKGVVE